MIGRLTDGPFDRMADSDDIHLVQALRRTAERLGDAPQEGEPEGADRLRSAVRGLLDDTTSRSARRPGRPEEVGDRFERFYDLDQGLVDRARAALMAYHDRPDAETAGYAADAVEELGEARDA